MRALRLPAVQRCTGLSKASIYRFCSANQFPKPFRIGANIVVWDEADIDQWLECRKASSCVRAGDVRGR